MQAKLLSQQLDEEYIRLSAGLFPCQFNAAHSLVRPQDACWLCLLPSCSGGIPHCFPQFGPGAIQQVC